MDYRRGRSRTGGAERDDGEEETGRGVGEGRGSGGGGRRTAEKEDGPDGDGRPPATTAGSGSGSDSMPKSRRRRPWLRVLFALFLVVEGLVLYLVNEYSPVYVFEITSVTVTGEDGVTTVRFLLVAWRGREGRGKEGDRGVGRGYEL